MWCSCYSSETEAGARCGGINGPNQGTARVQFKDVVRSSIDDDEGVASCVIPYPLRVSYSVCLYVEVDDRIVETVEHTVPTRGDLVNLLPDPIDDPDLVAKTVVGHPFRIPTAKRSSVEGGNDVVARSIGVVRPGIDLVYLVVVVVGHEQVTVGRIDAQPRRLAGERGGDTGVRQHTVERDLVEIDADEYRHLIHFGITEE